MSYTNWINSIIFSPDVFWNGYDFSIFVENNFLEVNKWRNRKSLLRTLIRERNGSEKSWFLQGNACQGNSSKLQSLTAGVCCASTGMQS